MIRIVVLFSLAATLLTAQEAGRPRLRPQPAASKDTKTGPAIGERVPTFELADQSGSVRTFADLRGPNGMLLAFVRSADWCPYCKTQLVDLNTQFEAYRRQGLSIVSISYDTVAILKNFGDRQKIDFPMLSDEGSKVIRAFGILNTNVEQDNPAYGIPFPGMYVLDANGVVEAKYFEDDYTERYSGASVLTREFGAQGVEVTSVDSEHVKLTSYASDATFAPGRRITLVAEIETKPGMRVSAPLDWQMAEAPTFVAFAAEYPASNEADYTGKVRILRDITIGSEREIGGALGVDRSLTVEGKLRYQACDSSQCFPRQEIPLKWTFHIGQMEMERVPAEIRVRP